MRIKASAMRAKQRKIKEDKNEIRTDRQQDIKIYKLTYF